MPSDRDIRVELRIDGMRCGGCVAGVERALSGVPEVAAADVNLAAGQASVACQAAGAGVVERLVEAVRRAGYDAAPLGTADTAPAGGPTGAEPARWGRLAFGLALSVPVVLQHFAEHWLATTLGLSAGVLRLVAGVLAVGVCIVPGGGIFAEAWRAVRGGRTNMDVLVGLGAGVALLAGWLGWWTARHELILFHATVMIVMFIALGRTLEAHARRRARGALEALFDRLPDRAWKLVNGRAEEVSAGTLREGDRVRLAADTHVPLDVEIDGGHISVDESLLTGESLPVERGPGQTVLGGTRIADGLAEGRVIADGTHSTAARIADLIRRAQASKTPWQRLADQAAGVFVPIVIALAVATFAGWWLAGAGGLPALERAIAVLVIACPCALGLATPVAALVGSGRAAEVGVLFRDSALLERAGRITHLLLDKTGTLTAGRPALEDVHPFAGFEPRAALRLGGALAEHSQHPYSQAIAARRREEAAPGVEDAASAEDFASHPGAGLSGRVAGQAVLLGSAGWLAERGVTLPPASPDGVAVWLAVDGRPAAGFAFADPLHPEARRLVERAGDLGIRLRILSGDRAAAVARVAAELGIDDWRAELRPEQKLADLEGTRGSGRVVAFVGDGVNDAPALQAADVGIAIGAGTDVARGAADVCLLGHSPLGVLRAVGASRATRRVMLQNIGWAVGYNVLMLPAAVFLPVPPGLAAAAMMFSSLSVVLNALRLRRIIR